MPLQQVRDVGTEVLDDDLDFLADVRRMQFREPHDLPRRSLRIHKRVVLGADACRDAGLAVLLDLESGLVRLVAAQDVENEALLDCLPHRVHVERDRLAVIARTTEELLRLRLRRRSER